MRREGDSRMPGLPDTRRAQKKLGWASNVVNSPVSCSKMLPTSERKLQKPACDCPPPEYSYAYSYVCLVTRSGRGSGGATCPEAEVWLEEAQALLRHLRLTLLPSLCRGPSSADRQGYIIFSHMTHQRSILAPIGAESTALNAVPAFSHQRSQPPGPSQTASSSSRSTTTSPGFLPARD